MTLILTNEQVEHRQHTRMDEDASSKTLSGEKEPPVFKALSLFLKEYAWDKSLTKEEKVA